MDKFWSKIKIAGPNDCWEWQRCRNNHGYGTFWFRQKVQKAHRVAWILSNGEIPQNIVVCHSCDNPACCNPGHLWLGTQKENVMDMSFKKRSSGQKKTHCPKNHEYSVTNTGFHKMKSGNPQRYCRQCKNENSKKNKQKKKEKQNVQNQSSVSL